MTSEPYAVTITVDVFDRLALYRAAMRRAVADGVSLADYLSMRRTGGDRTAVDLVMLLDPGISPAGCQIQDSRAEALSADWLGTAVSGAGFAEAGAAGPCTGPRGGPA